MKHRLIVLKSIGLGITATASLGLAMYSLGRLVIVLSERFGTENTVLGASGIVFATLVSVATYGELRLADTKARYKTVRPPREKP